VELVKTDEGRVDLVSELSPLETLRVAQSPFAKVVKNRWNWGTLCWAVLAFIKSHWPAAIRSQQAQQKALQR